MKPIKVVQRQLSDLIRVVFLPSPTELGKFTVRLLETELPKIKKELDLDFDELEVHAGAQPRESGDIELFKGGKLVKKISVKTAVSGDLRVALRKIWSDLLKGLDGIIIAFAYAKIRGGGELAKILLIYLPSEVTGYGRGDVLGELNALILERARREGYESLQVFAVNEALMFELVYRAVVSEDKAEKAYEEAKRAREKAEKAYEEVKKAREEVREVKEKIDRILKILSKDR